MSKCCVAFLFDRHSCSPEQFNLSFPSLPVACGACSARINGCLWMIASGPPLMSSPCYVKYFYLLVEKPKLIALKTTSAQNREHSTQGRIYTFQRLSWLLCELERLLSGPRTRAMDHAAAAKSIQSCPILCDPIDGSPPGSPIPGILQARVLEWGAIAFSNGS